MAARRRTRERGAVAVTGAASGLGREVLAMLAGEPWLPGLVAVDGRPAVNAVASALGGDRVHAHRVDLADPTSGALLAELLRRRDVGTVVHGVFSRRPRQDASAAHDLEVIGTLQVLAACAAARVRRLVLLSSTLCYGARPQNPGHLLEHAPLQGCPGFAFVQDKVEAEEEVARFAADHPSITVTVLRIAPLLGRGLDTLWSRYLRSPVAPTVLGRDPLVQYLHPHDALRAIRTVSLEDHAGVFNITGRGVVPLSTALRMAGGVPVPLPHAGARLLLGTLWASGAGAFPPQAVNYLCHGTVADGTRASTELGFIPQYGVQETILHLVGELPSAAGAEAHHG